MSCSFRTQWASPDGYPCQGLTRQEAAGPGTPRIRPLPATRKADGEVGCCANLRAAMTQSDRDRRAYDLAEKHLLALPGVTAPILAHYRKAPDRPNDLAGIYRRLLLSAQDRNMAAGVIGGSIGDVRKPAKENFDEIAKVTFNFAPPSRVAVLSTAARSAARSRRQPNCIPGGRCATDPTPSGRNFADPLSRARSFSWT
jgi:hypothetical protein